MKARAALQSMTNVVVEGFTDLLSKMDALAGDVLYLKLTAWFLAGLLFALIICISVRR